MLTIIIDNGWVAFFVFPASYNKLSENEQLTTIDMCVSGCGTWLYYFILCWILLYDQCHSVPMLKVIVTYYCASSMFENRPFYVLNDCLMITIYCNLLIYELHVIPILNAVNIIVHI